jgi:hypothetical protein
MLCFYGKNKIMNDKDFKIISSLESYMQYLTRKEMIELFKTNNTKWSAEQIQGLVNSSK